MCLLINRLAVFLLSWVVLATLHGCTTTRSTDTMLPPAQSWEEQQQRLTPLVYWNLAGKLGIKTEKESHSVLINWQQQTNRYAIAVTSPIGTAVAHIQSDGRTVQLTQSDNRQYQSDSLDNLLWDQLGWTLPADHLFYWVRGLPAPTMIDHQELDAQHQLTKLEQSGWSIAYLDYMNSDGYRLPKKMTLTNPQLKLTLLISEWHIAEFALASP